MAKKRLGELLLERGLIDVDQLNSALAYQRQWGHRLGTALVVRGFISEGNLTRVLSESLQIPMVDLSKVHIDERAVGLVKRETAERFEIFPIAVKEHKGRKTLLLAMADPLNVAAVDEVAFTTDMAVRPAIAQISSLRAALRRYYAGERIEIPPLDFRAKARANLQDAEHDATMTIIRRGGTEEVEVDSTGEVIDLTKEVEAAERMQELGRMGVPAQAAQGHDPYGGQPTNQFAYYQGQPTGAWMMAVPASPMPGHLPGNMMGPGMSQPMPSVQVTHVQPPRATPPARAMPTVDVELLSQPEPVEALEKKFWALMRILARKGLITKEEFLAELKND